MLPLRSARRSPPPPPVPPRPARTEIQMMMVAHRPRGISLAASSATGLDRRGWGRCTNSATNQPTQASIATRPSRQSGEGGAEGWRAQRQRTNTREHHRWGSVHGVRASSERPFTGARDTSDGHPRVDPSEHPCRPRDSRWRRWGGAGDGRLPDGSQRTLQFPLGGPRLVQPVADEERVKAGNCRQRGGKQRGTRHANRAPSTQCPSQIVRVGVTAPKGSAAWQRPPSTHTSSPPSAPPFRHPAASRYTHTTRRPIHTRRPRRSPTYSHPGTR